MALCFMSQGVKAIMKDVAKFLPGIGWTFVFMEYPFVKRDWKKDEDRLIASCKNLSDYPVNMLVSPQGLLVSPDKGWKRLSLEKDLYPISKQGVL